ncbi:hypothetical protein LDENG_00091240 [Lucifuga dentata]|nr:hypothetical protein LDENG_00091240 [Lucifuga dentata]
MYPCPVTKPTTVPTSQSPTTFVFTSTTPETVTPCTPCKWSPWYDSSFPTFGNLGGDTETYDKLRKAGYKICEKPSNLECRAEKFPNVTIDQVGQVVECGTPSHSTDKNVCGYCFYNGTAYLPGTIIYNISDPEGYCYTSYCNESCEVVFTHYQCVVPTSPPKHQDCIEVHPPRKDGESWKESSCVNGTCLDGKVSYDYIRCDNKTSVVCENNFPAVIVYDDDHCCDHYECQCICYGWGDPHYVTFDGTYYGFQGNCSYWLMKEILPKYNFSVMIDNYYCGSVDGLSCPQSLTIFYQHYKIFITQKDNNGVFTNEIYVNDKHVNLAHQNFHFRITTTGITTVLVIPAIYAKVTFSGLIFSIYLPFSKFSGNTEGQCGTCDNNRKNDCMLPSGKIDPSCPDMAHKWRSHYNDSDCEPVNPTPTPRPDYCNTTICDVIKSSVFEACHKLIDYNPFIMACKFDVCQMHTSKIGCTSIQTYADACAEAGVCVDWRSATHGLCEHKCPDDQVYKACGSQVELTCDSWYNEKFIYAVNAFSAMTNNKLEGCFCPNGTIRLSSSSDQCVHNCECDVKLCSAAPECPPGFTPNATMGVCCHKYTCVPKKNVCVYKNHEYQVGDLVPVHKCLTCTCSDVKDPFSHLNKVECKNVTCDTHCAVPGSIWTPAGNPCVKYECVKIGNQFITVEAKIVCPPYDPKECIPGTETVAPDGCCHVCNKGQCSVSTTGVYLENEDCRTKELINVTSCNGACGTFTFYSSKTNTLQHSCSCCQEAATSQRQVQLSCTNGTELSYTYTHIDACSCFQTECAATDRSTAVTPSSLKSHRRRR